MQVQGQNSGCKLASRWAEFLQKTALSVGSLLLASSVISWIAANWAYATKVQKLAGTQGLLVLLALMTAWLLYYRPSSRPNFSAPAYAAALASVCLGGLLALVGQIYQTGADPWQLFLLWGVLLLPWLVSVHTVILGLLVALLFNIAAVLYFDVFAINILRWISSSQLALGTTMVLMNLLMLAAWESAIRYLDDGWRIGPRVLGTAVIAWVVWANLSFQLEYAVLGAALLAAMVWFYTQHRRDVPIVAQAGLGISSIVAIQLIGRMEDAFGLLLIVMVLIAMTGWMMKYLLGLVGRSAPMVETTQSDSDHTVQKTVRSGEPWYISVFRVTGLVLTSLLLLLYLYVSLNIKPERAWLVGLVIVGVGLLVIRKKSVGMAYETGATLVCTGLFMVGAGALVFEAVSPYGRGLGLLVLAGLVYVLSRGFALRWLAVVFCLMLALAVTWPEHLWDAISWGDFSLVGRSFEFYFSAYLRVWWLSIFAVLALDRSTRPSSHDQWSPLAWALITVTQLAAFVLPSVGLYGLSAYWSKHLALMLLVLACAILPLVALTALLWSVRGLSAIVRIGAPLVLAVVCLAWMGAPGVSFGLLWLILGFAYKRRTVMAFGALSLLAYLGIYYYQLEISLLHKSWLLGATGLWLLASWWVLRRMIRSRRAITHGVHDQVMAVSRPSVWAAAGVVGGLLLMLAVVNNGIYQREQILQHGATVVLELAPVDPRSLMQGDYMALDFDVSTSLYRSLRTLPDDLREDIYNNGQAYMVLVPDAQGVHRLFGVQRSLNGPVYVRSRHASGPDVQSLWVVADTIPADKVVLEFRVRGYRVQLPTHAWFFSEGQAQHFEQARYGEFKVSDRGVGLLKDMLDGEKQSLSGGRAKLLNVPTAPR